MHFFARRRESCRVQRSSSVVVLAVECRGLAKQKLTPPSTNSGCKILEPYVLLDMPLDVPLDT
jgi:hypothetical protein